MIFWNYEKSYSLSNFYLQVLAHFNMPLAWINYHCDRNSSFPNNMVPSTLVSWFPILKRSFLLILITLFIYLYQCGLMASYFIQPVVTHSWIAIVFKKGKRRTSPEVQWLRLHTPSAGGLGSIPGLGTRSCMLQLRVLMHNKDQKIPYATSKTWYSQMSKEIKE